MDRDKASAAATLLERVAGGGLEASTALAEWPGDADSDELLNAGWHELSHFAQDFDIRKTDPRYQSYQISVLLKRAKQIREKYGLD
jgi:hypothetical protein